MSTMRCEHSVYLTYTVYRINYLVVGDVDKLLLNRAERLPIKVTDDEPSYYRGYYWIKKGAVFNAEQLDTLTYSRVITMS